MKNQTSSMCPLLPFFQFGLLFSVAEAEPRSERVQQMEVEVQADYDPEVTGPFLPDVEGTRINAGKAMNIRLEELPEISNDNFRQVLARTPGGNPFGGITTRC